MASDESCLERICRGLALEGLVDRSEPEAVFIRKVVTGSACAVAFDERSRSEIFQAAPRRNQRLSAAFITSSSVLNETRRAAFRGQPWAMLSKTCMWEKGKPTRIAPNPYLRSRESATPAPV